MVFFSPSSVSSSMPTKPDKINPTDRARNYGVFLAKLEESQQNIPPKANAGDDQLANERDVVILNALGSTDPDDGIASFLWEQVDGPSVNLFRPAFASASFAAPSVVQGCVSLTFRLTVADYGGLQNTDTIVITVCKSFPNGDVAPLGNPDGQVNVGDALLCLRFALGACPRIAILKF